MPDGRSDRISRRDKLRLKFVEGCHTTDLPDLALRELVLAGSRICVRERSFQTSDATNAG